MKKSKISTRCLCALPVLCLLTALWGCGNGAEQLPILPQFTQVTTQPAESIPPELLELLEKNPDAREYVLGYPENKDKVFAIDLKEESSSENVPRLYQWDKRWGYGTYAGELMGLSGCGPTCLSMVCIYLYRSAKYDPQYIARFSEQNGYSTAGSGSSWTLISEGGKKLGLDVTEIPLDKNRIIRNLEVDNLIICVMGPGDFTTTGHFIVLTGYADGKVRVNDPNSIVNSDKLWELEGIMPQMRNLWVCRR